MLGKKIHMHETLYIGKKLLIKQMECIISGMMIIQLDFAVTPLTMGLIF